MNKWFLIGGLVVVVLIVGIVLVQHNSGPAPDAAKSVFPYGQDAAGASGQAVDQTPISTPAPNPKLKKTYAAPTQAEMDAAKAAGTRHAVITTGKGVIEVDLFGQDAPLTVANFVKLANAKFYNGLTFHRVGPSSTAPPMIQGGDPNGDGSGGPGYAIRLETSPKLLHDAGMLAMARSNDPNSAGSQFYITVAACHDLDNQYAVFGKVTKGLDVAKTIVVGDKITSIVVK